LKDLNQNYLIISLVIDFVHNSFLQLCIMLLQWIMLHKFSSCCATKLGLIQASDRFHLYFFYSICNLQNLNQNIQLSLMVPHLDIIILPIVPFKYFRIIMAILKCDSLGLD